MSWWPQAGQGGVQHEAFVNGGELKRFHLVPLGVFLPAVACDLHINVGFFAIKALCLHGFIGGVWSCSPSSS